MKILVIEDQTWKYNKISKALELSGKDMTIDRAETVIAAKHLINVVKYDKIICDMQFPLREGYRIDNTSGIAVLLFKEKIRCINKKTDLIVASASDKVGEVLQEHNFSNIEYLVCDASTYIQDRIDNFLTGEKSE